MRTTRRFGPLNRAVAAASLLLGPVASAGTVAAQDPPPPDPPDSTTCLPAAGAGDARQDTGHGFRPGDPAPPRMLYGGFLESTGHTLPRGRGYAGAGYMGGDWLAQIGTSTRNAIRPYVVHAAYGITDDLMVGVGSGFARFRGNDARFEYHPYVAAKYRLFATDRFSAAVGGFWGVFTWSNFGGFNSVLYGFSASYSRSFAERVALNGTIGMYGRSIDRGIQINHESTEKLTMAIGAELQVLSQVRLVGELRSFGGFDPEEGKRTKVLSGALRYLGRVVGVEAGLARWLVPTRLWLGATRPVVSVAYRF